MIRTAPARRFTLTDCRPGPVACRNEETLTAGWTTTDLMLEAASFALITTHDAGFTFADLVAEVRELMEEHGIQFVGTTSRPDKYKDDAERVVAGRFGDLLRSGVFAVVGGDAA